MSGANNNEMPNPAVVGIGASAGGIAALQTLLESLPPNPGAAFVVIIHLDPTSRSELPEILAAHTSMPVVAVTESHPLRKDHVYVIPPDRQLEISENHIAGTPFREPRGKR